jgi:hypothetical protein
MEFLTASVQKGYKGTVSDVVALSLSNYRRTNFSKLLRQE